MENGMKASVEVGNMSGASRQNLDPYVNLESNVVQLARKTNDYVRAIPEYF